GVAPAHALTIAAPAVSRLALFDLDGTLLDGDTDVLWCAFLVDEGVLDCDAFDAANRKTAAQYADGAISAQAFCDFYAATLAGRTAAQWSPLRDRFVDRRIVPRLKPRGLEAVERHRASGDRVVLTTATNRFLTEPIAALLGIADLIATDLEVADGVFTGRTSGIVNMREGKVTRLRAWLAERGLAESSIGEASFYSDSRNDLPLLAAVAAPVAVDPDDRLRAEAVRLGWPVIRLA
ncbi:MAG: HAD-IB family hydrolase, partial [Caldimonas sp.]